jgi:hypothetical protein
MTCMGNGEMVRSLRRDRPTVSITPVLLVIAISGEGGTLHSTVLPILCKVLLLLLLLLLSLFYHQGHNNVYYYNNIVIQYYTTNHKPYKKLIRH